MTEAADPNDQAVREHYRTANALNVQLIRQDDASIISQAETTAKALIDYVRSKTKDFEDFTRRVQRSDEFSLHDSAQVETSERTLKIYYQRAVSLKEAINEALARRARKARKN